MAYINRNFEFINKVREVFSTKLKNYNSAQINDTGTTVIYVNCKCGFCRNHLCNYIHLIWLCCLFSKTLQMKENFIFRTYYKLFSSPVISYLIVLISNIVICSFQCKMTRITFFLPLLLLFLFFQDKQGGQIGLVVDCEWAEANSEKIEDKSAAARRLDFQLGWYFCLCSMFFLFR